MKTNGNLESVEVKNTRKKLIFIFIIAVIILILVITNNSSDKNTYNDGCKVICKKVAAVFPES